MASDIILDLVGVTKYFPGVIALSQVDLQVRRGEIHGLVGENGAGKSTLIGILNGVHRPDDGQLKVNGVALHNRGPSDAAALGMSFIHQEPTLFPDLSVSENIFPGGRAEEPLGLYQQGGSNSPYSELLTSLKLKIEPLALVQICAWRRRKWSKSCAPSQSRSKFWSWTNRRRHLPTQKSERSLT